MDCFGKLCPPTQDSNKNTEIFTRHTYPQVDNILNVDESNLTSENYVDSVNDDSALNKIDDFDSNELCNLENVAPITIDSGNSHEVLEEIEINSNAEHALILNNDATETTPFENLIDDEVLLNVLENMNAKGANEYASKETDISNDFASNSEATLNSNNIDYEGELKKFRILNTTHNTQARKDDKDDENLKSLREFEEVLNHFDKTACIIDNFAEECIDLDEFSDIFDELNAEDKDSNSENKYPLKTTFENNIESTKDSNKEEDIEDFDKTKVNSEINADKIETDDVISINSSTEDDNSQRNVLKDTIPSDSEVSESDSNGYNSSDFEFISETEAHMDGFIINFRRANFPSLPRENSDLQNRSGIILEDYDEASDPGEGPSGQRKPKSQFEDRSYRDNHRVPEGNDYLDLFQGIYNPLLPMSEIYFLENKSVRASAMNIQYDGIGFDKQLALRRHVPDSSEDEFEDEAKECAKRILNMYPGENRKRRRRYL